MSEREEYTPSMDRVRHLYARTIRPDGTVELASRRQKEFDRWLSAHDRALREQVAKEIEVSRDGIEAAQLQENHYLPPNMNCLIAGYTHAARIARGEGSE